MAMPPRNGGGIGTDGVDVSSIITQVARPPAQSPNRETPTMIKNRSELQSVRLTNGQVVAKAEPKLTFLQRFLCCGAKDRTIPQQQDGKPPGAPPPSSSSTYSKLPKQSQPDSSAAATNNGNTTPPPNKRPPTGNNEDNNTHNSPNPQYGRRVLKTPSPAKMPQMGPIPSHCAGKMCLALDLDETLVHSSFQPVENASFIIDVTIEGTVHNVYVTKRPGVDEFLRRMAETYELVIYTASLSKYADPLLDILDPNNVISKRLFRENCVFFEGHYVKDLSLLNREVARCIIVDNSPMSYVFHPENAIDCGSFFDDPADVEMWQIADFLESIANTDDVRAYCRHWREWCESNPSSVPTEMLTEY